MALSKVKRVECLVSQIDLHLAKESIIKLGKRKTLCINTVNWLGPCAESRILRVERILEVTLPNSYRHFVALKGGGGIEEVSILGIPPKGSLKDGGNIGYFAQHFREEWVAEPLPPHLIPIHTDSDLVDPYCLDTSRLKRGECPVVLYFLANGIVEETAQDFISFYEQSLAPYLANAEA